MADCSASGTAIDRLAQAAVFTALNQAGNNGATSSTAAASAATQAFGNLALGGVGINRRIMGGVTGQQVMPLAPLETIGGGSTTIQQHRGIVFGDGAARLDTEWAPAASPASTAQYAPMNHHVVHSHHQQQQHMRLHIAPQMMMQQQQQQQQMMMMQQMQIQQQQMAAMVQYQQNQQHQTKTIEAQQYAAEQHSSTGGRFERTADNGTTTAIDDDVATVSEEGQLNHEGITEDVSAERLARAWREAEAEYATDFREDEYDVSDMGGLYSEGYQTATTDNTATNNTAEPHYEFSEASQTYGCLETPTTDIAPPEHYPADLYDRGLRHFAEGDLRAAILCFESTLQNIDPEHADAWQMLGKCHTENDEDRKAIACWCRTLERDPFSPETLLLTAVAFVNELDHERALATLRSWVAHHPLYAGMPDVLDGGPGAEEEDLYGIGDVEEVDGGGGIHHMRTQTRAEMREVERLLLRALEYDATADAAADVYEALGVVYNVSQDYDAAVSAFRRAIEVRPHDYQLRNKLGATLANSNRSEEALPAYSAALKLKPKYARGFLNMAIAHSNLHNYSEAARCYLQTLSLNPEAGHVWSYLRIALTCDERWGLLPLAAEQNLGGFREHFDFVEY